MVLYYIKKILLYSMVYDSLFTSLFTFINIYQLRLSILMHHIKVILILLDILLHTLNHPNPRYCWDIDISFKRFTFRINNIFWEIGKSTIFTGPLTFVWFSKYLTRIIYIDYKHVPYQINEMTLRDAWQGPISIIYLIIDRMEGAARGCC